MIHGSAVQVPAPPVYMSKSLEQDYERLVAPGEQVGALRGSVNVCAWVNVRHNVKCVG